MRLMPGFQSVVTALLACLLLPAPPAVAAGLIGGGSCTSQGSWTAKAIQQGETIKAAVEQLKNDPNCKALVEAVEKVSLSALASAQSAEGDLSRGPGARYEELPKDLMALRTVVAKNPGNAALTARLSPVLAQSTVDMATNNASLVGPLGKGQIDLIRHRMKRTLGTGQALLSALFTALPQNQQCLQKGRNSDTGLSLISAATQMMAAFSSSGEANGSGMAALMSQFNNFLREMKAASVVTPINVAQFWAEMSCFLEATQESYCSVKDGLQLLDYQAKEAEILARLRKDLGSGKVKKDSAIEGYLLMGRELAGISQWLQKVQYGVEPKTSADSTFKNSIWNTVNGLNTVVINVQGVYNENLSLYKGLSSVEQKQQNIRDMLGAFANMLDRAGGNVNFFTQAVPLNQLPLFLLGRNLNEMPEELFGRGAANGRPMSSLEYLADPSRVPELKNPDQTMSTILTRLSSLAELASREGSKYFAQNMTIDHLNLVDDAFTSSSVTVYQSLKNVRHYVSRLNKKYSAMKDSEDAQRLTLSMADTVSRLDRVLRRFDDLNKLAKDYNLKVVNGQVNLSDMSEVPEDQREKVKELYKGLVTSVYDELNLLQQKDTFLPQRLSTYVRFDLNQRLRTKEDMSPYVQYLLLASGRNVLGRFQDFQNLNAAQVEADLSEAQRLNRVNLEQIEKLFAGDVWNYVNSLSRDTGNEYVKRYTDNPFRSMTDRIIPFESLWQSLSHLPGPTGKVPSQDDDKTLSFLRAKMCVQTLGFANWADFQNICKGAVLESRLTSQAPKDLRLSFRYDDLVREKNSTPWQRAQRLFGQPPPTGARFQHTCMLRDFYRNNQVYWLTLDASQPEEPLPASKPSEAPSEGDGGAFPAL